MIEEWIGVYNAFTTVIAKKKENLDTLKDLVSKEKKEKENIFIKALNVFDGVSSNAEKKSLYKTSEEIMLKANQSITQLEQLNAKDELKEIITLSRMVNELDSNISKKYMQDLKESLDEDKNDCFFEDYEATLNALNRIAKGKDKYFKNIDAIINQYYKKENQENPLQKMDTNIHGFLLSVCNHYKDTLLHFLQTSYCVCSEEQMFSSSDERIRSYEVCVSKIDGILKEIENYSLNMQKIEFLPHLKTSLNLVREQLLLDIGITWYRKKK